MSSVLIVTLCVAILYLAKRWLEARSEAADLRSKVAVLKRRLTQAGR